MRILPGFFRRTILLLILALGVGVTPLGVTAQDQELIPAIAAFDSPGCSDHNLGGTDIPFLGHNPGLGRSNPEYKVIILPSDAGRPITDLPKFSPTILEGFVLTPPPACAPGVTPCEGPDSQMPSEVSEEEVPWNHYTHDFTFKVVPDPPYQHLLSSWVPAPEFRFANPGVPDYIFAGICASLDGSVEGNICVVKAATCPDDPSAAICRHTDMEVEWENASAMNVNDDLDRVWGGAPEFVWPAVGDRVWVEGRWIFDCGHPNVPKADTSRRFVQFSTEIHPPRALVAFRLNHPALFDTFTSDTVTFYRSIYPASWLPVTGAPVPGLPGPTNVPVTEADIFVSGNGGGANDLCMIVPANSDEDCQYGHTNPVIPVNDRNYVFDIYPPGTCYRANHFCRFVNGTFPVTRPVPDASLQWRVVDQSSQVPTHACAGVSLGDCVTVDPIICLLDSSTPPPDQTETGCPAVPAQPTRLRVILPFAGSNANFFAKSILVGWDDVPTPPPGSISPTAVSANLLAAPGISPCDLGPCGSPLVRTFAVTLHAFTVNSNGGSTGEDWRVFANVGGQYRYISSNWDRDPSGKTEGKGDDLTDNGNGDYFLFDDRPWYVSVVDGTPIHVAVGGYESDSVDADFLGAKNHRGDYPNGTDPFTIGDKLDLATLNDDRIGPYEFDLNPPDYQWKLPNGTTALPCGFDNKDGSQFTTNMTKDEENYKVEFCVKEIPPPTAPISAPLRIGDPNYVGAAGTFIAGGTPMILTSTDPNAEGFQYRFRRRGTPLPTYPSLPDFPGVPVHWAHVDLPQVPIGFLPVADVFVGVANSGDGPYDFQYSAESFGNVLEKRLGATVILDTTPPVITIAQPAAVQYPHSAMLTLDYSESDGDGSGVQSVTPKMDGATTLPDGTGLASGQTISLLTELSLGTHTFSVNAVDNVNNASTKSVTFSIIVTPDSIKEDVQQFLQSGAIDNAGIANSLLAKLDAAARARARGNCSTSADIYQAFINELQAQSGKHVDPAAAAIMIADAQYLIAHCP